MLDDRSYMRAPYRPAWKMTHILLVTLVACFLAQWVLETVKGEDWVNEWLALSKTGSMHGRVYQLITFQFLHAGIWHLLMNMIGLYFFGRAVEDFLGSRGLLKLYLTGGLVGGLAQTGLAFLLPRAFGEGAVVGASAGVFALIAAFATRSPDEPITLLVFLVLPVTFKAKLLLIIEGTLALLGVLGPIVGHPIVGAGIANGAHLGGMLTGIVWIRWGLARSWSFSFLPQRKARRDSAPVAPKRSPRNTKRKVDDLPPAEFISREVDPILEKISAHGIHSLTERERQILEAARSKMARR